METVILERSVAVEFFQVTFQSREQRKQNSIHFHCHGLEASISLMDIFTPGQIELKSCAWLDTTKWINMYFVQCGWVTRRSL